MTGSRRKAREAVLQALYWSESAGDAIQQTVRTMAIRCDLTPEAAQFAARLATATWDYRDEADRRIASVSHNWSLGRISRIDRLLLQMALTEIRKFPDIPVKVSIDEAIEMAKRFSHAKASGFVNGILDTLAKSAAGEPPGAVEEPGEATPICE